MNRSRSARDSSRVRRVSRPSKISTVDVQPSRRRAGGDQQLVVRILSATRDHHLAIPVDPGGHRAEPQGDVLVGVGCLVGDPVRLVGVPQQHGLGQRRSLVRELALLTDQRQLALISLISKRDGGADAPASEAPTMTMRDGCELVD